MATKKEIAALKLLVSAALKVNASSERVNAEVDIDTHGVNVRISDPVAVTSLASDCSWGWLFYSDRKAYFSDDCFTESAFLVRCKELTDAVLSFEGRTVSEFA